MRSINLATSDRCESHFLTFDMLIFMFLQWKSLCMESPKFPPDMTQMEGNWLPISSRMIKSPLMSNLSNYCHYLLCTDLTVRAAVAVHLTWNPQQWAQVSLEFCDWFGLPSAKLPKTCWTNWQLSVQRQTNQRKQIDFSLPEVQRKYSTWVRGQFARNPGSRQDSLAVHAWMSWEHAGEEDMRVPLACTCIFYAIFHNQTMELFVKRTFSEDYAATQNRVVCFVFN